jgi:hypothetical protein
METEATLSKRPRPWLLVALAVAVVAAAAMQFWPTNPAPAGLAPSNPRSAPGERGGEPIDPAELDVRLGDLKAPPAEAEGADRNPFRFQPKPPPPPPPEAARPKAPIAPPENAEPPGPPPPPPIPLKFIGTVEPKPGDKVAAFSDCRYTFKGREGDIIDGRYRLVRIGVESVVMEYVDGRGRMTIRLSGQECVGR